MVHQGLYLTDKEVDECLQVYGGYTKTGSHTIVIREQDPYLPKITGPLIILSYELTREGTDVGLSPDAVEKLIRHWFHAYGVEYPTLYHKLGVTPCEGGWVDPEGNPIEEAGFIINILPKEPLTLEDRDKMNILTALYAQKLKDELRQHSVILVLDRGEVLFI